MSSILKIGDNKVKCQKFTPNSLVETMLDLINYNTDLMGKTVLENSFGTGQILKTVVIRYIENALKKRYNKANISTGLSQDIYGIELDKQLYDNCVNELNSIVQSYEIPPVNWNLHNKNALTIKLNNRFDYIIGNPPYISYKEMDVDSRKSLKKNFISCSIGKFDYCYAFIELGISLLKDTGKLVQLIPNNIYKNVFAQRLRDMMVDHISIIYDYPNQKLFDKTLTSVSVFLYDKNNISNDVLYQNNTKNSSKLINRNSLCGKWLFTSFKEPKSKMLRFGDYFNASVTIATLYNKAFLIDSDCKDYDKIETSVLRDAVSPKTLRYKKNKKIIFPYKYEKNNLLHYSNTEFAELFPNAVKHLEIYSKELSKRNSDKNAEWFEYGRSQALVHLNDEKLLISTIITNEVEVYKLDANTIPFSGIYITIKNNDYSLDDAIALLKSSHFMEYIRSIGINVSGKSLRISCKDINNYKFFEEQLNGKTTIYS